jgi:integrase
VHAIDTGLVLKVLEPLWATKTETASRLRGRIESILDWAKVRGYREGENPARWRGHLDKLLPSRAKVQNPVHLLALPYDEVPELMTALRAQDGVASRALEFAILTATRTAEVLGARWDEIDLAKATWAIPAVRMKAGKEHRIPLSSHSISILRDLQSSGGPVFSREGKPLGRKALIRALGRSDAHVHGFRSTFRDWAAECTSFPREIAEMALAHSVGDAVEAAYRRTDLLEKRRKLMEKWGAYCTAPTSTGKVIAMR